MYYITSHTDQIIAADESLLHLLEVADINMLIEKVFSNEISFLKNTSSELEIVTPSGTYTYTVRNIPISSMLGDLHLMDLKPIKEDSDAKQGSNEDLADSIDKDTDQSDLETKPLSHLDTEDSSFLLDNESSDVFEKKDAEEIYALTSASESPIDTDIDTDKKVENFSDDSDKDSLLYTEDSTEDISSDINSISLDIEKISKEIGISSDDYKTFLSDYIDTAKLLKNDLQSKNEDERQSAAGMLAQLAEVLHLPNISPLMHQISVGTEEKLSDTVESFYQILSKLDTGKTDIDSVDISADDLPTDNIAITQQDTQTATDISDIEDLSIQEKQTPLKKGGFGKIYLEDVKPIHFDFQLEAAASDLSLPVELIEEFVHDFIEQAHSETKKMLQAYEEGDLKKIQKIGHLLKGASSNLRINELSDTLYDIQFCEDVDKLEGLIERYWAHFISFEKQINIISKK